MRVTFTYIQMRLIYIHGDIKGLSLVKHLHLVFAQCRRQLHIWNASWSITQIKRQLSTDWAYEIFACAAYIINVLWIVRDLTILLGTSILIFLIVPYQNRQYLTILNKIIIKYNNRLFFKTLMYNKFLEFEISICIILLYAVNFDCLDRSITCYKYVKQSHEMR